MRPKPLSEPDRVAVWLITREMADKAMGKVPDEARYVTGYRRRMAMRYLLKDGVWPKDS